ncbi:MAG: hydroxymethylbilane synthase [Vicinamibacterales bacterium]
MDRLRIGTRGSELALFQANAVAELLARRAGVTCDIVVIKTSGDRLAEASLAQIGGKRLFVKEIEDALAAGEVDLAVHSSKDMPAVLPGGLQIGAVLAREDPHDAIVLPSPAGEPLSIHEVVSELGHAPRIGTSSVRRVAQLIRLFPGATFLPVRGNLGTRLRKLDGGEYDALVLAAAGLRRLGRADRITATIPADACVPAPGQGIIAVEIRDTDERAGLLLAVIDDAEAAAALRSERAVVTRLGGGCQMPIGALADVADVGLSVRGVVISPDGQRLVRASASGSRDDAEALGRSVADQLLRGGAGDILADVQRAHAAVEGIQP